MANDAEGINARINDAVTRLEERSQDLMKTLRNETAKAEATAQEHLWVSLLSALGLGLIVGLLVGFTRR